MATNKTLLVKGIRYLAFSLPLMFIGPSIIHSSFKNQGHPFYIPILGLGVIFCIGSMFLMFRGIQTMIKGLFDGDE
ncbi:hypothetical protein FLJC2902T_25850 [Flavobacterium limnosediminis JC2902]|uniref:Uncharacterized protein n=1 Tax=Flavobacterium limnosediminis JC2902 TaxID=1341181 RepID=V6SJ37_9FLAO|nr:DUF6095 family protein [Flavobacterium limnosediminis]ESU26611.1 hypothetical protein FLJC2902T_25850 [Flavobacterium limnosediminis JC2902]